jgi:two-component system sensor histidine kinase BaeS
MVKVPVQPDSNRVLLSSASQELKTPLTAIRGYAEGLAEGVFTAEEAVDTILAESSRLEGLIRDLLDVARIERGCFSARRERIDLMAVGRSAVARHDASARRRGVALVGAGVRSWVVGDPERVDRISSNLVECAMRPACTGGSRVVVSSGPSGLTVSNAAIVAPPAGVALRLLIATTLAAAIGGEVSVRSGPAWGISFTLRLPGAAKAAAGRSDPVQA